MSDISGNPTEWPYRYDAYERRFVADAARETVKYSVPRILEFLSMSPDFVDSSAAIREPHTFIILGYSCLMEISVLQLPLKISCSPSAITDPVRRLPFNRLNTKTVAPISDPTLGSMRDVDDIATIPVLLFSTNRSLDFRQTMPTDGFSC